MRALPSEQARRRALERALLLAAASASLSGGRSIVPRSREDRTLISTGAGLMGAAAGLAAEGATATLARLLPGARRGATALLGGLGLAAGAWSARRGPLGRAETIAETASRVVLFAAVGGELALAAYARLPGQQRSILTGRVWTTALGAASALAALRRKLAEPRDLVKASIVYDYLPSVSGGEGSLLPLAVVDREGRKFLGGAVPAARIAEVMGGAALDPIRVYAGLESGPTEAERAELAVAELERLGGFERGRILFFCPTGSGFVNPVAAEAEEYLSCGDVASVVVQYSHKRSVRARKDLPRARATWQALLERLDRRLDELPPERRPEVAVYGESLGAQVVAEVIVERGVETIGALDIFRGALVGIPYEARMKMRALRDRGDPLPEGLGVFFSLDELAALDRPAQERIRYLLFTHAEDPVGNFSGSRLLWERPEWLRREERHPRLPPEMRWLPGITFLHLLFDVKNGTSYTPRFEAHAHDYRSELPALLRVAFGHLDVTGAQLRAIEAETARSAVLQAERAERARVGPRE